MTRRLDMHMHTVASDGSLYAYEMAEACADEGLGAACVADHDSTASIPEFREVLARHGIATANAIELTSSFEGKELHILGYGFDDSRMDEVEAFGARCRKAREDRDGLIIHLLSQKYPEVDETAYAAFSYDRHLRGGNRAAQYIYTTGIASRHSEYVLLKKPLGVDDSFFPSSEETVAFLRSVGALTVLAHPSYYFRGSVMDRERLDTFIGYGIQGIECLSPYNPEREQYEYYRDICRARGLAVSAGSDSHGPVMSRRIGVPYADDTLCDILERLEI